MPGSGIDAMEPRRGGGQRAKAARARCAPPHRRALALLALTFVVPTAPFAPIGTHASVPASVPPTAMATYAPSSAANAGGRSARAAAAAPSSSSSSLYAASGGTVAETVPPPPIPDGTTKEKKKKKTSDWKGGEYNSTLASRLLYRYADPLLDVASKRRLESKDAFRLPEEKSMRRVVSNLKDTYQKCRSKAAERRRRIEANGSGERAKPGRKLPWRTTSESYVLATALLRSQQSTLVRTGTLRLLNTAVQAFPALLIARLLRQIEAGNSLHPAKPLWSALLLVSVLSVKMVVENAYFHGVVKCACEVRGGIAGMIFDKSLRLSSDGGGAGEAADATKTEEGKKEKGSLGSGAVMNLMQSDATTVEALTMQLHTLWDGLLQISVYISLLYRFLGPPVMWGVSVLLATIPINAATLRVLNRLAAREAAAKDARMRKTTESVGNMPLLKLQGWERIFARDVQQRRGEELDRHSKKGAVRALNQAVSNVVPTVTLVATLSAYAKTGKPILASTIFTAISLFNQLRFPLFFYPMLIDSMANGRNSLRRISSYLAREEIKPYVEYLPKLENGGSIEMTNGNFLWSAPSTAAGEETGRRDGVSYGRSAQNDGEVPALRDASLSVAPGEVVAVVGGVGSGKTALAKALVGELHPVSGGEDNGGNRCMPKVATRGSIAYCAQEAWLPKGTIRESVVFGRAYDEKRYLRALYDAGLDEDVTYTGMSATAAAANGFLTHDTDVGEGGSNLSGGQRARVALARALYDNETGGAGVYVLDDVLAALDASVGSTVFERVTKRLRREGVATVFVTNDPNLPRRCDRVVLMGSDQRTGGSRIVDVGTYNEMISRGHDLRTIHSEVTEDGDSEDLSCMDEDDDVCQIPHSCMTTARNATSLDCHADPDCKNVMKQDPVLLAEHVVPQSIEPIEDDAIVPSPSQKQRQLSTDDSMATGAVPWSTYLTYFRSVKNPLLIAAALVSFFVSNGSQFFQQLVIARWTEAGKGAAISAAASARYLNKLVLAAGMVSASMYLRSFLTMRVGVGASRTIHEKMLESTFRAPLSFFSATPSGQLLTRFGKELEVVDRSLPDGLSSVLFCFLQIFFSTLALAGVVTPLMTIPLGLVGYFYIKTMGRFRPASRDLKRCESKSRSPIYTHFREALRGVETIRSIPSGRALWSAEHQNLEDENIAVYHSVKSLDRWLSVRLESLGNVIVFTAAVASVFLTRAGRLKSGSAGWGLTQALSITGLLTWAVRVLTDLETQFMSVMRVAEITDLESALSAADGEVKPRMPREYSEAGEALRALAPDGTAALPTPTSDAELLESGWYVRGKDTPVFRYLLYHANVR